MIHHFGVRGGKITLNRMVELLATNPAKLFGLYPRKGTLAVGSDADIVVFDPDKRVTISAAAHHSRIDYNLYEGTEVVGSPETVLLRGNTLVEDGELVGRPGIGRYVARARFGEELQAGSGGPGLRSGGAGGELALVGPVGRPTGESRSLPQPRRDRAPAAAVSSLLC